MELISNVNFECFLSESDSNGRIRGATHRLETTLAARFIDRLIINIRTTRTHEVLAD